MPQSGADYAAIYLTYLETPAPVVPAVRTLIDPDSHPALFHCAADKDRTGVVGALLLDLLGVEREAIGEDYGRTAEVIADVIDRLQEIEPYSRHLADVVVAAYEPTAAINSFRRAMTE